MKQYKTLLLIWFFYHLLAMQIAPLSHFRFVQSLDPFFRFYINTVSLNHSWSFFVWPEMAGLSYHFTVHPAGSIPKPELKDDSSASLEFTYPSRKKTTPYQLYDWSYMLLNGKFQPLLTRAACQFLGNPNKVNLHLSVDPLPQLIDSPAILAVRAKVIEYSHELKREYPCQN